MGNRGVRQKKLTVSRVKFDGSVSVRAYAKPWPGGTVSSGKIARHFGESLFRECRLWEKCQTVCKPGSVPSLRRGMTIRLGRPLPDASRDLPGRRRGNPPAVRRPRAAPIRSCSRCGLPCHRRYRRRGALLPHPFTLTLLRRSFEGRFAFCGTFPGVAPAGRYPAPCFRGARTFLPPPGFPVAKGGHPTVWRSLCCGIRASGQEIAARAASADRVSGSGTPSTRRGR